MCPFFLGQGGVNAGIICFGIKVFLLIWIIFVPIAITARLERIIKLLEENNKLDTQIKIDEVNNLGTANIRIRSLLSTMNGGE